MTLANPRRPRFRQPACRALVLVAGALVLCAGCSRRHSVLPGLWELEFSDLRKVYADSKVRPEKIERPADRVEVVLDYNGDEETVEIYLYETDASVDAPEREEIQPLTGTIRGRKIRLDGRDLDWQFVMSGTIESEVRITGALLGRPNVLEDASAQGRWIMRKLVESGE